MNSGPQEPQVLDFLLLKKTLAPCAVPAGVNAKGLSFPPPPRRPRLIAELLSIHRLAAEGTGSHAAPELGEEQTCRGHAPHLSHTSGNTSASFANRRAGPAFLKCGTGDASVALGGPCSADCKGVRGLRLGVGPFHASPGVYAKAIFSQETSHSFH